MSEENKPRKVFEEEIRCPNCKKYITIKKTKTLVSEPIPAEYDVKVITELSKQTKLTDVKKTTKKENKNKAAKSFKIKKNKEKKK